MLCCLTCLIIAGNCLCLLVFSNFVLINVACYYNNIWEGDMIWVLENPEFQIDVRECFLPFCSVCFGSLWVRQLLLSKWVIFGQTISVWCFFIQPFAHSWLIVWLYRFSWVKLVVTKPLLILWLCNIIFISVSFFFLFDCVHIIFSCVHSAFIILLS